MRRTGFVLAVIMFAGSMASGADGTSAVELSTVAETEIKVLDHEGRPELRRVEATRVVPGDEVIYTIYYSNSGAEEAEDVVITNAIPEHMTYTGGSASGSGAVVTYSVDGGSVFALPERLRMPDGNGGERPATGDDYTHIRWTFGAALAPNEMGAVGFRARLD